MLSHLGEAVQTRNVERQMDRQNNVYSSDADDERLLLKTWNFTIIE